MVWMNGMRVGERWWWQMGMLTPSPEHGSRGVAWFLDTQADSCRAFRCGMMASWAREPEFARTDRISMRRERSAQPITALRTARVGLPWSQLTVRRAPDPVDGNRGPTACFLAVDRQRGATVSDAGSARVNWGERTTDGTWLC